MKSLWKKHQGDSPNRVERSPNYRPRPEPKPLNLHRGGTREFQPTGSNGVGYAHVPGEPVGDKFLAHLERVLADEVKMAQYVVDGRRRCSGNSTRLEVARRAALREPMLNANPRETQKALEGKHHMPKNRRLDKEKPFKRIVVKPNNAITGKHGWYERLWTIHKLRYSRGIVGVTDEGEETLVFPDWGSMRASIKGSGWIIIREEVPQGGNRPSRVISTGGEKK